MIKKYSFENFHSYKNEVNIDFSVSKKAPHSYYDYELEDGNKIAKVISVLGPNGAGKSNLLKPLSFLSWFIPDSFGKDLGKPAVIPHSQSSKKPTKMYLEFVIPRFCGGDPTTHEFKYELEITRERVVYESLKMKTSRQYSNIISRQFDEETSKYNVKNSKSWGVDLSNSVLVKAPGTCSIISYAFHHLDRKIPDELKKDVFLCAAAQYLSGNLSNLGVLGRTNAAHDYEIATEVYLNHPEVFEKAKSLLIGYDMGIDDIKLEKRLVVNPNTGEEVEQIMPIFVHENSDGKFHSTIFLESSGTQSAYCVLSMIFEAIQYGNVLILDEFDNDMHAVLATALVELFKSEANNPNNAQLLFNTHNTEILKTLRMQHCYLVEKVDDVSDAYRADEVEGLKARDNLYSKYISGALGAIPELEI